MKKIIVLAGAGGSGKTTIAQLLERDYGYVFLDGDNEDTEFFPNGGQWLPENSDKIMKSHDKIISKAKSLLSSGHKVVIDYIIFDHFESYFKKINKELGEDAQVFILYPLKDEVVKRDLERECWTTGEEKIEKIYSKLKSVKKLIGADNYIDTTGQTPQETIEVYLKDFI